MLSILITKLLLKGAIKTFILKPLITATATIIPSKTIANASLLGFKTVISSKDIYSFSVDKVFDRLINKKLEFQIKKLSRYKYKIFPKNKWAEIYFNSDSYISLNQLTLDLSKFEHEIDLIINHHELEILKLENALDDDYSKLMKKINSDYDFIDEKLEISW